MASQHASLTALQYMLDLIDSGMEFQEAHAKAVTRLYLSDEESEDLASAYDAFDVEGVA